MSIFRSYFLKNNTLIEGNQTNNSQNPVGEISYGTPQSFRSRIIFKPDFTDLQTKLANDGILRSSILSHKLHLVNTIANRPDLLGTKSYSDIIERASSFNLDLFSINEDWDEGSGYNFIYQDQGILGSNSITGASNWYQRKTNTSWSTVGAYSGSSVITTQAFPKGNEDINMDITNLVNSILYSGATDYGMGLKYSSSIETLQTLYKKAVAFHLKNTNTVFEPYIETIFNDQISDDRNYFYMDKSNSLYLYSSGGDVVISGVTIYDFNGAIYSIIPSSGVTRVRKGIYKITLSIDSSVYPDAVIFNDKWTLTQNNKVKTISQDFYLISPDRYYNFDLSNFVNPDNFHFSYSGIKSGENIRRGDIRKIQLSVKQLYDTQDDSLPLTISYRLFMKQGGHTQMDVIPYTSVNRTSRGYEFEIDTSWLIPQDYYLELKYSNNSLFSTKSPISFTIVNDEAFLS